MGEVVVDTKYLLDHSAEFTLKQEPSWSDRDWSIGDGDGKLVFRTESRFMESHRKTRLLDATGNQVVCFQEKPGWSTSGTWDVFSGSSELVLFSLKNSRMVGTQNFMNVFLPSNSDNKNPDYKILCPKLFGSTFSIVHGTEEVAVVTRVNKWYARRAFTVTVVPGTDNVFILVLVIIAEFGREERRRAAATSTISGGTASPGTS